VSNETNWSLLIAGLLKRHGWNQRQLAHKLAAHEVTVSRWLAGKQDPHPYFQRELLRLDKRK
jgi:transcriptional regulator with XRE-family HTH domain